MESTSLDKITLIFFSVRLIRAFSMQMTLGMFKNGREEAAIPEGACSLKPFPTPPASQNTFLNRAVHKHRAGRWGTGACTGWASELWMIKRRRRLRRRVTRAAVVSVNQPWPGCSELYGCFISAAPLLCRSIHTPGTPASAANIAFGKVFHLGYRAGCETIYKKFWEKEGSYKSQWEC